MPLKFIFQNEIHRAQTVPANYSALLQQIKQLFGAALPMRFNLQYEDSEGDRIILSNEEDYQSMLSADMDDNFNVVKVFISEAADDAISVISRSCIKSDSEEEILRRSVSRSRSPSRKVSRSPSRSVSRSSKRLPSRSPRRRPSRSPRSKSPKCERSPSRSRSRSRSVSLEKPCKAQPLVNPATEEALKTDPKLARLAFCALRDRFCAAPRITAEERLQRRQARLDAKNEGFKKLARDVFHEELPTIALIVKQLIQNDGQLDFNMQPVKKEETLFKAPKFEKKEKKEELKKEEPKQEKAIHKHVICDVCGMKPIVGARYKCTVIEDYDMCENCEAKGTHPYPLLKIRTEAQHPYKVITVIDEDELTRTQRRSQIESSRAEVQVPEPKCKKEKKRACSKKKIAPKKAKKVEEPVIEMPKVEEKTVEIKPEEPKIQHEETAKGEDYDCLFVKEINQIPSQVTEQDFMIYKTVSVKNTGEKSWPKNSFLTCVEGLKAEESPLPEVAAGKEFSTVLMLNSPAKAGTYVSKWRMGYVDLKGERTLFGAPFEVTVDVKEGQKKEENKKKEGYPQEVISKARELKELFPEKDIEDILAYVAQVPQKSLQELVEDYLESM